MVGTEGETLRMTRSMATGDPAAVDRFYRRYFSVMYTTARRSTGRDEAFCLDVVQSAVLRIVRTIRTVETEPQLVAWLRLVVRTTALDLLRAESRRSVREQTLVPVGGANDDDSADRLAWLWAEVDRFDPRLAELIDLRYRRGWTLQKIAGRLGLSVGTVDGRLRRAIAELRTRAEEVSDD